MIASLSHAIDWFSQFVGAIFWAGRFHLMRLAPADLPSARGGGYLLDRLERFVHAGVIEEFLAFCGPLAGWFAAVVAYWF